MSRKGGNMLDEDDFFDPPDSWEDEAYDDGEENGDDEYEEYIPANVEEAVAMEKKTDWDSEETFSNTGAVSKNNNGVKDKDEKPPERMKVEMQILHMSEDSQNRMVQALAELHGGQYKMKNAKSYKDTGRR